MSATVCHCETHSRHEFNAHLLLLACAAVLSCLLPGSAQLRAQATSTAADTSFEARFAAAQQVFDAARKLADTGTDDDVDVRKRYLEAAHQFSALAADGARSVNLFVNTANAYTFAGDPARGLLWYLRARKIANTAETRRGIATLRRIGKTDPELQPRGTIGRVLMFWHYDLQRSTKQRVFFSLFPPGCGLLLVAVLAARARRTLLRVGFVLALLGAGIGASDLVSGLYPPPARAVVVRVQPGRAGNGESYSVLVPEVRAGQEVRIIEAREAWVHIALPSGPSCWLPAAAVEKV